jgi:hypothetical protein
MSETPSRTAPTSLPILGQGKHRDPARGACFMEYTSVLAGEAFNDSPPCVDAELAAVLRGANDMLSDQTRPLLVPLLGRAIGLVVRGPDGRPAGRVLRLRRRPPADASDALVARLRQSVSERLIREVGVTPSDIRSTWYGRHTRVSRLFFDLMNEPDPVTTSDVYVDRLVERLEVLHRCYEDAMDELGVPRVPAAATAAPLSAGRNAATPGVIAP